MSPAHDGLIAEGIWHAYGPEEVLRDVGLDVRPGEVHCLIGPSGSGKSSFLRLVAGLEPLGRGRIEVGGVEVATPERQLPPERRSVGFVFQDYALFPHLDVRRNVGFGLRDRSSEDRRRAVDRILEQVGMHEFAAAMPHTLSGGQQQRVALARAIVTDPSVMLLDEPFSGLDARLRGQVRATTLEVLRSTDTATLIVTHDPAEALLVGDRISALSDGRLLQTGTPEALYGRSRSHEVAEMFGPVNRISAVTRQGEAQTPWGSCAVSGRAEGVSVQVLVRPESLLLSEREAPGARPGLVTGVVSEGPLNRILVALDVEDRVLRLEALSARHRTLEPGQTVYVAVAEGGLIVPASGDES